MDFQFRPLDPPPELHGILRQSFFARGQIPYRSDKILPNGLAVAIFNAGHPHRLGKSADPAHNPAFAHSWLHGVQTTPVFNTPGDETHVLGLLFEPPGMARLFNLDMRQLTDITCDARRILPTDLVATIEAALPTAADPATQARVQTALTEIAITRSAQPAWLTALYDTIRDTNGMVALTPAYAAIGHSPRHVAAVFKRAVGVTPKVLCRIYRLQALLAAIDPAEPVPWTGLAHDAGFYDQPHFNHEFRAFAGLHPNEYLAQRRRDLPQLAKGESVSFAPQR